MNAGKFLILVICVVALGIPASADVILDFSGHAGGGISGNATTATGTNILIDDVQGLNTPLNTNAITAITNGTLNFSASGGSFSGGVYNYTGGSFTIAGADATAGINTTQTLVQGTISSLSVNLAGTLSLVTVGNNINSTLAAYFGVPTGPLGGTPVEWVITNGSIHLFNISGGGGAAFSASTQSTDLPDTPVPEPASVVMLGTALLGITHLVRRRATKA